MTKGLTQQELEQTAKVYQLEAVKGQLNSIEATLVDIKQNTNGIVTETAMKAAIKEAIDEAQEYTDNRVDSVHLEYRPFKKGAYWLAGVIIAALIVQFIALYFVKTLGGN